MSRQRDICSKFRTMGGLASRHGSDSDRRHRDRGVSITGTGLWAPADVVSNAELVESLTVAIDALERRACRRDRARASIARGRCRTRSSSSRHRASSRATSIDKAGVLDPDRMRPHLDAARPRTSSGLQAEMAMPAIAARRSPMAGRTGADVDAVIVGCSNLQRAYPAVAIEIQNELGAGGLGVRHERRVLVGHVRDPGRGRRTAQRLGVAASWSSTPRSRRATSTSSCATSTSSSATRAPRSCSSVPTSGRPTTRGRSSARSWRRSSRTTSATTSASSTPARTASATPHELVFRQRGQQVFQEVCPMVADAHHRPPRRARARAAPTSVASGCTRPT